MVVYRFVCAFKSQMNCFNLRFSYTLIHTHTYIHTHTLVHMHFIQNAKLFYMVHYSNEAEFCNCIAFDIHDKLGMQVNKHFSPKASAISPCMCVSPCIEHGFCCCISMMLERKHNRRADKWNNSSKSQEWQWHNRCIYGLCVCVVRENECERIGIPFRHNMLLYGTRSNKLRLKTFRRGSEDEWNDKSIAREQHKRFSRKVWIQKFQEKLNENLFDIQNVCFLYPNIMYTCRSRLAEKMDGE